MTISIGANTQNNYLPSLTGLDNLDGSASAAPSLAQAASNNFGPAVIISFSSQALDPTIVPDEIAVVRGERLIPTETITEADRQRLSQMSALSGLSTSATGDTNRIVRDLDLEAMLASFENPDESETIEDGNVTKTFSAEKTMQAIALVKRLNCFISERADPSLIAKAYQALNMINQSALGKTMVTMQEQLGTDLDGFETFMQNLKPGQALKYIAGANGADEVVVVTATRPPQIDPMFWNAPEIPYVNPPLHPIGLPEIEIPFTEIKFDTEAGALNAGIAEINKHPDKNRKELGFFVYKDNDGKFRVSELLVGVGRDLKINIPPGAIPPTAVGFLHSHPAALLDGYGQNSERETFQLNYRINRYPSNGYGTTGSGDIGAWAVFEARTNNPNFKLWIIGPDGIVREFTDQSVLPSPYVDKAISGSSLPAPPSSTVIPQQDLQ